MKHVVAGASLVLLFACGGAPDAVAPPVAPVEAPSAAPVAPASSTEPSGAPPSPSTSTSAPAVVSGWAFRRETEGAATWIALEKPPHAAAIGPEKLWVHDAKGWRAEALPRSLTKQPYAVSVFYGRDDRVRVVGSRGEGASAENVYLRGKPGGGLAPEPGEIGKLAAPGALVAVLGTADPEIVCRPGDLCIVKRRSGWTMMAAPSDLKMVTLGGDAGWGIAGKKLLRLGDKSWTEVPAPGGWESADALFALRDRAWVIETAKGVIHAFDGSKWTETPSPVERPRAMWGAAADGLWLAGDGGLARLDGTAWSRVADAPAPLAAVAGRGPDDVWIAGASGVFRVERRP